MTIESNMQRCRAKSPRRRNNDSTKLQEVGTSVVSSSYKMKARVAVVQLATFVETLIGDTY